MQTSGVKWNPNDDWKEDPSMAWSFKCMYAIITAWLMAQPTNDKINMNFRPLQPISLYVTNVDANWMALMKIDDNSGDMFEPEFATIAEP